MSTNLLVSVFGGTGFFKVHPSKNSIFAITFFNFSHSFLLPLFFFESGFFFYQLFFFYSKILKEVKLLKEETVL